MRAVATTHLGAVLVVRHVTDVVETVLNLPVTPVEREQARGVGLLGPEAGRADSSLHGAFAPANHLALQICRDALDEEHLPDVREVEQVVQRGARPNAPRLDSPVAPIDRLVLRGGKPPPKEAVCRPAAAVSHPAPAR